MTRFALLAVCVAVLAGFVSAEPEAPLKKTENQALAAAEASAQKRAQRLLLLRRDVRSLSLELDRGLDDDMDLEGLSAQGLSRVRSLREKAGPDAVFEAVLQTVERFYRDLPKKRYAAAYGAELVSAVSSELSLAADSAQDEDQLLAFLDDRLTLPNDVPSEEKPLTALEQFPENLTIEQFQGLGTVRTFMVKHRLSRPKSYTPTTAADLEGGHHHVQVGVEISGTVGYVDKSVDRDYCFSIGNVSMEMTPDWQMFHPGTKKPKLGDKIRVKGWTYYDVFHKAEKEWDPKNPVTGDGRVTLWEIHPVQDVEIISGAQ